MTTLIIGFIVLYYLVGLYFSIKLLKLHGGLQADDMFAVLWLALIAPFPATLYCFEKFFKGKGKPILNWINEKI
jgi:hypothetical protein